MVDYSLHCKRTSAVHETEATVILKALSTLYYSASTGIELKHDSAPAKLQLEVGERDQSTREKLE